MFSMQKIAVLALATALGMVSLPRVASAAETTTSMMADKPTSGPGGRSDRLAAPACAACRAHGGRDRCGTRDAPRPDGGHAHP